MRRKVGESGGVFRFGVVAALRLPLFVIFVRAALRLRLVVVGVEEAPKASCCGMASSSIGGIPVVIDSKSTWQSRPSASSISFSVATAVFLFCRVSWLAFQDSCGSCHQFLSSVPLCDAPWLLGTFVASGRPAAWHLGVQGEDYLERGGSHPIAPFPTGILQP